MQWTRVACPSCQAAIAVHRQHTFFECGRCAKLLVATWSTPVLPPTAQAVSSASPKVGGGGSGTAACSSQKQTQTCDQATVILSCWESMPVRYTLCATCGQLLAYLRQYGAVECGNCHATVPTTTTTSASANASLSTKTGSIAAATKSNKSRKRKVSKPRTPAAKSRPLKRQKSGASFSKSKSAKAKN